MLKSTARNEKEALAYLLDCTLATVETLAMKKSRPKGEFDRQKEIAQRVLDWCEQFEIDISATRGEDVRFMCGGDVDKWATRYMPESHSSEPQNSSLTPEALYAYAMSFHEKAVARDARRQFPSFREASKRFRCSHDDIENAIDSYEGPGYMGAVVGYQCGSGIAEISVRGDHLIEVAL
jgi:hypothetical protein